MKIVTDSINCLLEKNQQSYEMEEMDNKIISEKQLKRVINNIGKKSIYFRNEAEYRYLFFYTKYDKKCLRDSKYYLDTMKSILELYFTHLDKKINENMNTQYIY
jgi:hypothetical protein